MSDELQVNSKGPKSIHGMSEEDKRRLYEQIRSIEHLQGEIDDLSEDRNENKKLLREEWNIESDVLNFVLRRRKSAADDRHSFDDTVTLIEEGIAEVEDKRRSAGQKAREKEEAADQPDEEVDETEDPIGMEDSYPVIEGNDPPFDEIPE